MCYQLFSIAFVVPFVSTTAVCSTSCDWFIHMNSIPGYSSNSGPAYKPLAYFLVYFHSSTLSHPDSDAEEEGVRVNASFSFDVLTLNGDIASVFVFMY